MAGMTITEALAEMKLLDKRLEKKQEFVRTYLMRQEKEKDPFDKDGGSKQLIKQEMQSINDLQARKVAIRRAIQEANANNSITVLGETRPIADWLVWRREIAENHGHFMTQLQAMIQQTRERYRAQGVMVGDTVTKPSDYVVNLNEKELVDARERFEEILGLLDGQLSLKNATIVIDL